jgi:RNA polymerase sigma factor (TIGR02999 family)
MEEPEITRLLGEARRGNAEAQSELASLVYRELHKLAGHYMRGERPNHTLQATGLVNEAFLRMIGESDRSWQNRTHFFAVAAQVMRRILIDYARNRGAQKRGAAMAMGSLNEPGLLANDRCEDWLAVDEALDRLARRDPRMAKVVELRFFAGLTENEIGEALSISPRTVKRDWRVAKAWLRGELASPNVS